ncbi:AfsR/SARP family transcriptional regulator [Microbispora sp. CA-102843]|uniref:AfsR/SARP family transcriptional regulator n=1 Tax=Microbispora sp. CA-102843 TaxID=3239952 RepID=UPI003D8AB1C1
MIPIRVLGALEAEVDGAPAQLGTPRQRGVPALLVAARGEVVSAGRLIDDLWRGPRSGRGTSCGPGRPGSGPWRSPSRRADREAD